MEHKKIKNIVTGILKNEYGFINEYEEYQMINNNSMLQDLLNKIESLYNLLSENMTEEQIELLDKFELSRNIETSKLKEYYFKRGLISGLTNLSYLKEIDNVEFFINEIEL